MVTGRLYQIKEYMKNIPEQEKFVNLTRYVTDDTKYIKFSDEIGKYDTAAIFDPKGPNGSYKDYAKLLEKFNPKKKYKEAELAALPEDE